MPRIIKRRLSVTRPGQEPAELRMHLRRLPSGFWKCGNKEQIQTEICRLISWGRVWYLPHCNAYGFRAVVSPGLSYGKELWVLFDDPLRWKGDVAMRSEAWVERIEPQRSRLYAAEFFCVLLALYVSEMLEKEPSWLKLTPLERLAVACAKEPFKSAVDEFQFRITTDENIKHRTHENVVLSRLFITFNDGSYIEYLEDSMTVSNKIAVEVMTPDKGRVIVDRDMAVQSLIM